MSTYVLPQVQVFQDLNNLPSAAIHPLNAHITGPNGQLVRYAQTDEKESGFLGYYDSVSQHCYPWPNQPAGSVIDLNYTELWIQDALLNYFVETGAGGGDITKVSGYNNQIRSSSLSFIANGVAYPRSATFDDRDVQIGDIVKVRVVVNSVEYVLWTYVNGFVGDVVASTHGAATADANNPLAQSFSTTAMRVSGPENCISLQPNGTGYKGSASGYINETYTIIVTASSSHGNFSTARVRVLSASGTDDQASVTPAAVENYTAIGTRGLLVKFHSDNSTHCSISAVHDTVSPVDLILGQTWQVVVHEGFTPSVPTAGGAYTGTTDTTYIVQVTKGGAFSTTPQISVTTSQGIDISGPTNITASGQAVTVGTHGITISFSGGGLRLGNRYSIAVTGQKAGAMKTLVLGNNLDTNIPAGTKVDVRLFIRKPSLQVSANRTGSAPLVNWAASASQICVLDGIVAYDPTWTLAGVMQPLPVMSEVSKSYGRVYVQYRAWLPTLVSTFNSLSDAGLIGDIPGQLDPDNPLKWGVYNALLNSNGIAVGYTAVSDPLSVDAWSAALQVVSGRVDTYGLIPLTHNQTVLNLWEAHVNDFSTPGINLWRVLWTALQGVPDAAVVSSTSSTDKGIVLAVLEDNPAAAGIQYSQIRVPAGNAQFVTNGVRAGDILRYLYTGDGFGNYTYTEFVVSSVLSEDALILSTAGPVPVSTPQKIEIWRNLSPTDEALAIAAQAGAYSNTRVRAVWPDTIDSGSTTMDGVFLCCALAGLRSGVAPHQGLTNVSVSGFTGVPRTVNKFNRAQLDSMAGSGVWIVTSNPQTGEIYSRHALTTGNYAVVEEREEMSISNIDSISYRFAETYAPFIGQVNAVPSLLNILKVEGQALIEVLKSELFTPKLGGQIVDATITDIHISTLAADTIIMTVTGTAPAPLNVFQIHLQF